MQANAVHSGFRLGKQIYYTRDIFVLAGSKEKGGNISKPWVISKADLHFCVRGTSLRGERQMGGGGEVKVAGTEREI